jgi:chromate reductase, NAD(P)H dehydrogenase (quinone)
MLTIALVSGSTRTASTNTAALRTMQAIAPPDMTTTLYSGLSELPAFTPDADHERPHPAVAQLRAELIAADAIVFCTPEYAGTLPGSFKNLLDWTVGTGELYEKPVAWINVAIEGRGGGAESTLRSVLHYVSADIVEPACRRILVKRDTVGREGLVDDPVVRGALAEVLERLATHLRTGPAEPLTPSV